MSGVKDEIGENARDALRGEGFAGDRDEVILKALDDRDRLREFYDESVQREALLRQRVAELEAQLYQKQISIKDLGRLIGAAMNKDGTAVGEELNRLEESGKQLESSEDG